MTKIGVGVGEEFPVEEPPKADASQTETAGPRGPHACGWNGTSRRHGWVHVTLSVLLKLAIIGFVAAAAVSLFTAHRFADGAYGYYPYPHHFFFPFFPILFLVLILFAFRRDPYWRHRHWHDHWHRDRGEGV
jgi:hypothetical protein